MASDDARGEAYEAAALLAQDLAAAGKIEEAERAVRALPDAEEYVDWFHEKVMAFIVIANAHVKAGHSDRGRQLCWEAVDLAERMHGGGTWEEADALLRIGSVMLMIDAREDALDLWRRASSICREHQRLDEDCSKILARIGQELACLGLWDEAIAVAGSIEGYRRQETLNYIASRRRGRKPGVPD